MSGEPKDFSLLRPYVVQTLWQEQIIDNATVLEVHKLNELCVAATKETGESIRMLPELL